MAGFGSTSGHHSGEGVLLLLGEFHGYAIEGPRVSSSVSIEKGNGPEFLAILARVAFWTACAFVFVRAALPNPPMLPGSPSDTVQHVATFASLAMLGRWAYPEVKKRYLIGGLALFGAWIEGAQAIPALNRDSDRLDWVADIVATLIVFVIIGSWTHVREPCEGGSHS